MQTIVVNQLFEFHYASYLQVSNQVFLT